MAIAPPIVTIDAKKEEKTYNAELLFHISLNDILNNKVYIGYQF